MRPLAREELAILKLVEVGPLAPVGSPKAWLGLAEMGLLEVHLGMDGRPKAYALSLMGQEALKVWRSMGARG